jgi:hypothetical protein
MAVAMSDSSFPPALVSALRRVLAPVVRLMLAKGFTLPMAVELLKRVFVEVAERDFGLDGKPATDSRVSLLTGVHRKDVRRLREATDPAEGLPQKVSLGAQLVAAWLTHPLCVDADRKPKALPRKSRSGEFSFEDLVSGVSKDIRARPVFDEWMRLGIASLNEADEVVLNTAAFVPQQGFEEKLAYLALNVGDHVSAAADNVLGRPDPWFERSVHYSGLSAAQLEQIRGLAAERGNEILQEVNALAWTAPGTRHGGTQRFTCGVYFYSAEDESDEPRVEVSE